MIKKTKSGYNLYSKSTGKLLGKHKSKKDALAQERAIQISKRKRKKK